MEWLRECHKMKEIKKSKANARKMIADARDPEVSATYEFIIDGMPYNFKTAQQFSDEKLANAIVVDSSGYYIRKALQNVEMRHERRYSKTQDIIKEEYRYKENK